MTASVRAIALETTSRVGEVALVEDGRIIADDAFDSGLKYTVHLLPLVERLCRAAGWRPTDVNQVYVSVGPGGFTGTRIGVTFAKTFAFATGAKTVAVPTPAVVVENAPPTAGNALVVVDARRGMVWVQAFARGDGGEWQSSGGPSLTTLAAALAAAARPVWLMGEGVAYHADAIDASDGAVHVCPDVQPRARTVARIGWSRARQGAFTDPFALAPVYVRRPEAEEKRMGLP